MNFLLPIAGPLLGVALGWGLKTLSDYISATRDENRTFRKTAFHILKAYKVLFDYDRALTHFRNDRPSVAEFEPWRAVVEARLLEEIGDNLETTSTAIELLASIDPPLAIRVHNTLRNLSFALKKDLSKVATQDEQTYAKLLYTQDEIVALTLNDLKTAALRAAEQSGRGQRDKVEAWFEERDKGSKDFEQSMDEQAELRNRAFKLEREDAARGAK